MSDKVASEKLEADEQNPVDNVTGEESAIRPAKKAKKKGKGKKRRESVESRGEDDEGEISLKRKGRKKVLSKENVSSDVQQKVEAEGDDKKLEASVTVDEGLKETVIEIQAGENQPDELEEVVVKKESAFIEGDNKAQEAGDSAEASGEEKNDEKKDSEEESKDVESPTVRRRATLSDLRSESIDKQDGEKAGTTEAASEVRFYFQQQYFEES